jgi:hypothetical protein
MQEYTNKCVAIYIPVINRIDKPKIHTEAYILLNIADFQAEIHRAIINLRNSDYFHTSQISRVENNAFFNYPHLQVTNITVTKTVPSFGRVD